MMSFGKSTTPAHRRYVIRIMAFTIPYVAICVSMMTTDAFDEVMGKPAAWILAAAVAAPVIGQIWATLALMRESDEFVRAVTAKQFIIAAGMALASAPPFQAASCLAPSSRASSAERWATSRARA